MDESEEKARSDYRWNMYCARYWYTQIGKHPKAKRYWKAHLEFAQEINDQFKKKSKRRKTSTS